MSLIKVKGSSITGALPAVDGSALTGISAGKIVQTKMEGNYNWSGDASTNSTTYSGFGNEITITPTSSSNALLFMMDISDVYAPSGRAIHINIKDKTNSTWVTGGETRNRTFGVGSIGDGINTPFTLIDIIETAGSGARTYQGYFKSNASDTVYINNGGNKGYVRFCIMEVVKG